MITNCDIISCNKPIPSQSNQMSLDKAIKHGKEKRTQYRHSLAFDRSCRNHGNCGYCESNRTIQSQREKGRLHGQEDEYYGWHNLPDVDDFSCPACDQLDYFCSNCFALPTIDEDDEDVKPDDEELLPLDLSAKCI